MHASLFAASVLAISLATGAARAADGARPTKIASVEFNPLGLLAHQTGGQLQIGVAGHLSLVAGVSHLTMPDAIHSADDTGRMLRIPTLRGWLVEVGPRLSFPVASARRADHEPSLYFWGGASLAIDVLSQGTWGEYGEGVPDSTHEATQITRPGLAVDGGITWPAVGGFYLTAGFGLSLRPSSQVSAKDYGLSNLVPTQRGEAWPRILFAVGWGF